MTAKQVEEALFRASRRGYDEYHRARTVWLRAYSRHRRGRGPNLSLIPMPPKHKDLALNTPSVSNRSRMTAETIVDGVQVGNIPADSIESQKHLSSQAVAEQEPRMSSLQYRQERYRVVQAEKIRQQLRQPLEQRATSDNDYPVLDRFNDDRTEKYPDTPEKDSLADTVANIVIVLIVWPSIAFVCWYLVRGIWL